MIFTGAINQNAVLLFGLDIEEAVATVVAMFD